MTPFLQSIDHINIVVKDLEKVAAFFISLGFALEDQSKLSGEWISKTVGLTDVEAEYAKLTLPGDGTSIELIRFENPPLNEISNSEKANTKGFRHLAFRVGDIEKTVALLKQKGIDPVSAIQEYSKTKKKLVYFRGPEGILLELAQYAQHMIETKIVNQSPMIVHHSVTGLLSVNEAKSGATIALSVVRQIVALGSRLHLLLDMRGYVFDNLESHKIWSIDFKQNSLLSEHVDCVAVVGDPSPNLFAEKEMLETEELKFFTDFNLAYKWLQNQEIVASDLPK